MKIYIDGSLYDKDDAKVSVFDHGLLYGDGVFEGIRAYNGRVFRLEEHVERFFDSARGILLDFPLSREEAAAAIVDTVRASGLKDAYIRAVLTRGAGDLGLDMRKCKRPTFIIIVDKIALYPEAVYRKGLDLVTSSLRRPAADVLNPAIKSLNYLTSILARAEATRAGAHEAVLLNQQGHVAECTGDNIFMVHGGRLRTPPLWSGILGGITRAVVLDIARGKLGLEAVEDVCTTFDLYRADEVFVTGTGAEVIGAVRIDGRVIGNGLPGPVTQRIVSAFREYANSNGTPVYEAVGAR